jgi:hypothetical protein
MRDLDQHTIDVTPRRSFFGRIAAMSALGMFGLAATAARTQPVQSDGPDWPGTLKGRHRQVFDIYDINEVFRSVSQTISSLRTSPRRLS